MNDILHCYFGDSKICPTKNPKQVDIIGGTQDWNQYCTLHNKCTSMNLGQLVMLPGKVFGLIIIIKLCISLILIRFLHFLELEDHKLILYQMNSSYSFQNLITKNGSYVMGYWFLFFQFLF